MLLWYFPSCLDSKASVCNAGYSGSIPGSGRSPGERNGNPLLYSCLENPMDRGAWQTTVHVKFFYTILNVTFHLQHLLCA